MPSILVTPPATEPVSLADAKAFPRVEHNDDDALIAALIAGVRLRIEAQTRRALITHVSRLSRDIWTASSVLPILPAPLRQVLALRVFTLGGAQSVDAENLAIETMSAPARLTLCAARCRHRDRCRGRLWRRAGRRAAAAAPDDPAADRALVRRALVAASGEVASVPRAVTDLIAPYRVISL